MDDVKCEVEVPWISKYPNFLSMAMAKDNPYYEIIQHFMLR